ncbi:MAG: S8 family peptidase [Christensenellales bacterium]
MKQKIDPSLYESVFTLSSKENVDCLIYSNNPRRLKNYFIKNKKMLGIDSISIFPFIGAIGINVAPSSLPKISSLKIVDYVSRAASVQAMIDVSRKIMRVDEIHNAGWRGEGVTICYIDTGLSPHMDFVFGKNRVLHFESFVDDNQIMHDDNGHGTFVCGIGSGNGLASGGRYAGIAPASNIVALKALARDGESGAMTILSAMQWVYDHHKDYNIKVVCMSFGSEPMMINDPIAKGAEMLVAKGIVVVAAAGNSGPEYQTIKSPGISTKIITVGGLDDGRTLDGRYNKKDFKIARFSSRGPAFSKLKPDVIAPSIEITSCTRDKKMYGKMSGTSVATPMIAGLCALILQKYPHATPFQVKQKLLASCFPISYNRNEEGYGLVDALKFVMF